MPSRTNTDNYEIPDLYHSQITEPIRVICVGAGFSGTCLAYKMKKSLKSFELTVYEKNPDVGGTWFENRYPGCACDVPAHIYTYSWLPKPDWSHYYAGAEEIQSYCKDFYDQNGLSQYVKFSHRIKSAKWLDDKGQYMVQIEDLKTGTVFEDFCHVLINAGGFLNKWRWPDIKGLESFEGPKVHSAAWDQAFDCSGKRVAVIGNGSSAIQIVPQIQKQASFLKVFMRSPTWISPAVASSAAAYFTEQDKDEPVKQFAFTEDHVKRLKNDPAFFLKVRRQMEAEINLGADVFSAGSEMQKAVKQLMINEMKRRIGPGHEELAAKLIPSWPVGCRRLTPGDNYLESLVKDNVEPVFGDIKEITGNCLVMSNGTKHEVDALICATGFDVSFIPSFEIQGADGNSMSDLWKDAPDSYLGLSAPNFPNYFIVCGPQGPVGNGSIIPSIEVLCDSFIKVMKKMQEENIKSLQPDRRVTDEFREHCRKYHQKTVWSQPCRSWYKNGKIDGVPQLWCGSALSYIKTVCNPRYEDYNIEYKYPNRWAFLGNGNVEAQIPLPDGTPNFDALAPYIRNGETEWEI